MTSDNIKSGVMLAGIGLAAYVAWKAYKGAGAIGDGAAKAWNGISEGAATVGGWVNPASDQNLAYQGVNKIGSAWTGKPDYTLGGAVYDKAQERGFSNPFEVFLPSSAGLIADEIGAFFSSATINGAARADAELIRSGGGGEFNGRGASGSW